MIAYYSNRHGGDLYAKASSGLGGEKVLVESDELKYPTDWTPDGGLLLYMNFVGGKGPHLWIHQTAAEKKDYPLLGTNFAEENGRFSPDGRWLAYVSEETGKDELFVVPFPASGRFRRPEASRRCGVPTAKNSFMSLRTAS